MRYAYPGRMFLLIASCVLLSRGFVAAQPAVKVTLDSGAMVYAGVAETDWSSFAAGELDFQSAASAAVRGRLTVSALVFSLEGSPGARFGVERLFIRANLPLSEGFVPRITLGKNNITWGKGAFFNAGNLFFGRAGSATLLGAVSALARNETEWLAVLYVPLGLLSFFEAAASIPLPAFSVMSTPQGELMLPVPVRAGTASSYGARVSGNFDSFAAEAAWHYSEPQGRNKLSCSLSGAIGDAELYGSYALALPYGEARISAGMLAVNFVPGLEATSLRIEALVQPEKPWTPVNLTAEERQDGFPYGAHLLADLSLGAGTFAVTARSLYSPVDSSAMFTLTLVWKPYQGLWYYVGGSMNAGTMSAASWSAAGGLRFVF